MIDFLKRMVRKKIVENPKVEQHDPNKFVLVPMRSPMSVDEDIKLVETVQSLGYSIQLRQDGRYEVWR
jgi:hypothetical protein